MKKNIAYLIVALYVIAVIVLGTLEKQLQFNAFAGIPLWVVIGGGFGFILPMIHSKTRSFSSFMLYVVAVVVICLIGDIALGRITALRIVEDIIMFVAPMLGWIIWNKAGCPCDAKMDVDC